MGRPRASVPRALLALALGCAAPVAACDSILGIDDHAVAPEDASLSEAGQGGADAGAEASPTGTEGGSTDAGTDASTADAATADVAPGTGTEGGSDAAATPDAAAGDAATGCGTCPVDHPTCVGGQCTVRGPTMVAVDGFYVDSTEVTSAQYQIFVAAKGSDTSGQPASCAWNTSYAPAAAANPATYPVTNVDWCDALAYCAWAGKHLCGVIPGGGPIGAAEVLDQTKSQWFLACGGPDGWSDPNANPACNASFGTGDLAPVATFPGCEGYYPGLFDLEGNAAEWVDSCVTGPDGGASDTCQTLGGSFVDETAYCTESLGEPRNEAAYDIGFRCCGG